MITQTISIAISHAQTRHAEYCICLHCYNYQQTINVLDKKLPACTPSLHVQYALVLSDTK